MGLAVGAAAQDGPRALAAGADYAATLERLLAEAEDGSAEAKLGLGMLYDLGLGVERDPAAAFRWYGAAAAQGLPEALFNVAVMFDSGTGVARDRRAAAVWYARAALRGNARAQLNLGILFELGDGVDRSLPLARVWLGQAAGSIDRARERLDALPPAAGTPLVPPVPLASALRGDEAELVWSVPGGGGPFLVEIVARTASGGFEPVAETRTDLSAALLAAPAGRPLLWRVSALGARDYAPSPWMRLEGAGADSAGPEPVRPGSIGGEPVLADGATPIGRVRFALPADDTAALVLAAELAAPFRLAGLMVAPATLGAAAGETRVRYGHESDADLAARIASALPGTIRPELAEMPDASPGLVEVSLAGGPAAGSARP